MVLIAVHGTASRFLPAERGTVHLSIELEHDDRATVLQQAAALHDRFTGEAQALAEAGAATWWGSAQVWFRAEHRYEGRDEQRRLVQIASASVQVRFRDFERLSTWVLEAGSVAGVSVERVEWEITLEHRAAAERELRIEAVRDAVSRAEAYASAVGGAGVALRAVWEAGLRPAAGSGEARFSARAMSGTAAQPGFELRPGDIEMDAAVTADFEVEPGS